ncbi:hypothetical protein MD484_g5958, partial [Candolleomyces efflorescens]
MARTKRTAQASGSGKAASTDNTQDEYESVDAPSSPPPTQLPTGTKRRARNDPNPTPAPTKKIKKDSPVLVLDSDNEEDTVSSSSTTAAEENAGSDDEDDVETPKASKLNPKKKGNLKTELGGEVGASSVGSDVFGSGGNLLSGITEVPIFTLSSSNFNLSNKDKWAASWVDDQQKTYLFVKARCSDDPFLSQKSIVDPWLHKRGLYKNLPNANSLQLVSTHESANATFTDGSLTSDVPGLSVETWDCFGIERPYVATLLRFPRQGQYVNPSTVDVTNLVFKESYSNQGPCTAFLACHKDDARPAVFVTVGGLMESFLSEGKNVGADGRPPWAKGVTVLGHRFEYEHLSSTFATLCHGEDIVAPVKRRHITFQTMNRRNANYSDPVDHSSSGPSGDVKVGKMSITTYKSPTKRFVPKNKTNLDFTDHVPVYDGRCQAFDPSQIASSLTSLPQYDLGPSGEIDEGSGVVVGYTASTSKYLSTWKLTFYLLWVVVVTD